MRLCVMGVGYEKKIAILSAAARAPEAAKRGSLCGRCGRRSAGEDPGAGDEDPDACRKGAGAAAEGWKNESLSWEKPGRRPAR